MDPQPIASPWFVFPLAAVLLVVIAGHMIALRELPAGRIPESRRRIRVATGWVMMFAIPMSAYGFGIATTAEPEVFLFVWTSIILMLLGVLILAGVDMVNSMRIHRKERAELELEFHIKSAKQSRDLSDESGSDDE